MTTQNLFQIPEYPKVFLFVLSCSFLSWPLFVLLCSFGMSRISKRRISHQGSPLTTNNLTQSIERILATTTSLILIFIFSYQSFMQMIKRDWEDKKEADYHQTDFKWIFVEETSRRVIHTQNYYFWIQDCVEMIFDVVYFQCFFIRKTRLSGLSGKVKTPYWPILTLV